MAGDLGFGALGDKAYTTIQAGLDIHEGRLSLGLFGRVRVLSQNHAEGEETIRERDWDEVTDFLHILRYVEYKRTFNTVTLNARAGELMGFTLGHGTMIRDYSNIADMDHPHTGVSVKLTHEMFDVAAMVDNLARPGVVAARLAVRPFKELPDFTVGTSGVMDPTAPFQVRPNAAGERPVDSAWNLRSETEVMGMAGLDMSYTFGAKKTGTLMPYLDVNTSFMGAGVHMGFIGRLPVHKGSLAFQAEYRGGSSSYAATYMDTFYDIERHQAGLTFADPAEAARDHRNPKLAGLGRGIYGGSGALLQAGLNIKNLGRSRFNGHFKVGYSFRPGPDAHSVWLRISSRPISRLDLGMMMMMRGLGGPHEDANGIVALAEGRYRIMDNLYALAQYSRTWSLQEDTRYFGILQSFNISVGTNWSI